MPELATVESIASGVLLSASDYYNFEICPCYLAVCGFECYGGIFSGYSTVLVTRIVLSHVFLMVTQH